MPRPVALVVLRTHFAARKIRRYSSKPSLSRLEWGLASECVCYSHGQGLVERKNAK